MPGPSPSDTGSNPDASAKKKEGFNIQYVLYILRWALLAYPGAILVELLNKKWPWLNRKSFKTKMVITQALLGAVVYWIDLAIFSFIKR